jgi:hypothetical protein
VWALPATRWGPWPQTPFLKGYVVQRRITIGVTALARGGLIKIDMIARL